MINESPKTADYEGILPSDSVLCGRARHWAQIMEKYKVDDTMCYSISDIEKLSDYNKDEEENGNDSQFESNHDENDKNDFKEILNETLKVVEKRKEIWKESGIDRVLESFCLTEIDNKVGDWLNKHVMGNMNSNGNNHNYESYVDKTKDDNISNINSHNQRKTSVFYHQSPKRRQLKRRYYYEISDEDDDSSLESVDTAKYILSNRKPYKTKTDTMTIKRFRNIRDFREKENNLIYKNVKSSVRRDLIPTSPRSFFSNIEIESSSGGSSYEDFVGERYSLRKRYLKKDVYKSLRSRNYCRTFDLHSTKPSPIKYNRLSSRGYLDEKLRRRRKKRTEKQLGELSLLAYVRRTPSPESSSTEGETLQVYKKKDRTADESFQNSLAHQAKSITNHNTERKPVRHMRNLRSNDVKNSLYEKKSEAYNFRISINEELPNELIENSKTPSLNKSILFQPEANSTEILNIHKNLSCKESFERTRDSENFTRNITRKLNNSNVTVIYSPKFESILNTTTKITDGKLKLTKPLLEDTIGKEYTKKLLKDKTPAFLNYEVKADSEVLFIPPQPTMSELSSDDDPVEYLCRPKKPHILEITANDEHLFFETNEKKNVK